MNSTVTPEKKHGIETQPDQVEECKLLVNGGGNPF
jgi:hypothetical protein